MFNWLMTPAQLAGHSPRRGSPVHSRL